MRLFGLIPLILMALAGCNPQPENTNGFTVIGEIPFNGTLHYESQP